MRRCRLCERKNAVTSFRCMVIAAAATVIVVSVAVAVTAAVLRLMLALRQPSSPQQLFRKIQSSFDHRLCIFQKVYNI